MINTFNPFNQKVWVVAVNMGYGHQRTAHPLRKLAFKEEIINANNYKNIPKTDKQNWEISRKFYEAISNFYQTFLIGKMCFKIFDQFLKIFKFYPKRDLSKPNFSLKLMYVLFKRGWGKNLILKLEKNPLSLLTTFFIPAFMAEYFNYPGEIFCIVCDVDISRSWVSFNPSVKEKNKIKYFAPTERVVERLKLYGVKEKNIFLTGYPLPLENIGDENLEILKEDLKHRLLNLDPQKKYFKKYKTLIKTSLGNLPEKSDHPLTIMFSIGGAGAQKEIGIKILKQLIFEIKQGKIKLILSAGTKKNLREYFLENIKKLGLEKYLDKNIEIIYKARVNDYFRKFNYALRKTDILWTKPSELSFYSALGLPIIIASPIGFQEKFNMRWLLKSGFGFLPEDLNYITQWFFDWLEMGYFAEAAMQGFIEGEKLGALNIQKIICENKNINQIV
ncbi:hypothetical protein CVV26_01340 [Candidatus Kuenenbacteria bacterium HGW-Kuenenbacteria-1]|uniref:DUF6938 domain-containing protein n=1 Tax=Candidatus Kuenenbacteria bacterium HGW-Kuenenbacteria-1 TaxID=2013812 RepID=A0A2N1UNT6_9BACT|nr:MAG: hypothetical protein CVV26_01340 [Candidatus Kuenenbacteria bacterium HGW-Kuenenbacteria-1]